MTATLDVTDLRKQFSIGPPGDRRRKLCRAGRRDRGPARALRLRQRPRPMRCVAGLEHPTSGEISIAGRLVSSPARGILVPPRSRDLGMVFQSYARCGRT